MLVVKILHDSDIESPHEWDSQWRLYSFNTDHVDYRNPNEFDSEEIAEKMKVGLAFWLSYYEHGNCLWMRADGPMPAGVEFDWDGVRQAGLVVWEHSADDIGGKTVEDRAKDADCFLGVYNDCANGNGYGYSIENVEECPHCGQDISENEDSCFGFYGSDMDHMFDCIASYLNGREFEISDDCTGFASDLKRHVKEYNEKAKTYR